MEVMNKQGGRGGRREGAGRKPKEVRTLTIAFSVLPDLMERITNAAADRGMSRSKLIVKAIESFLD